MTIISECTEFLVEKAEIRHDSAIAKLLSQNAMPGWVELVYGCEDGEHFPPWKEIHGTTIIGTDCIANELAGMASLWSYPCYLNGQEAKVGWLGLWRISDQFRNKRRVLRTGFEAMRNQIDANISSPKLWLAAVIEENNAARRLLEAGLFGFPKMSVMTTLETLAIPCKANANWHEDIRQAHQRDMKQVAYFLNEQNRARDLSPIIEDDAKFYLKWKGLRPENFLIYEQQGEIKAVLAIWDQSKSRKITVKNYRAPLKNLRTVYNLFAPSLGYFQLPKIGAPIQNAYITLWAVESSDISIWLRMLEAARCLGHKMGRRMLNLGFCDGDDLLSATKSRFRHMSYKSVIYGSMQATSPIQFLRPKIEIGLL